MKVGNDVIGKVSSVMRTGGAEILVITDEKGSERLVPLAEEIVVNIDRAAKTIIVDPPEGLLEL